MANQSAAAHGFTLAACTEHSRRDFFLIYRSSLFRLPVFGFSFSASLDELAEAIAYSHARREKVIIPAFAVERTQEMIYTLHLLAKDGRLPADMPVFVDSPLAIDVTAPAK